MSRRAFAFASALCLGALSAYGVVSCTSTSTEITPAGFCTDAVTLEVSSPGDGACIEAPDPKGTIPVTVQAQNFSLRPPGTPCAITCNCGYLKLYVDNVLNTVSGTSIIDAQLATLPVVYGTHKLTIEFVWDLNDGGGSDEYDAGHRADAAPGEPAGLFTRSVTVQIQPSCKDAGMEVDAGGGDAGGGDAGDAGSDDAGPGDAGPGDAGSSDAGDGGDGG